MPRLEALIGGGANNSALLQLLVGLVGTLLTEMERLGVTPRRRLRPGRGRRLAYSLGRLDRRPMAEFSKVERKALRELAGEVYEAEAGRLLEELADSFKRWRDGEILPSELLDSIHEFHQHQSRQLWSMYQDLREPDIVARGLAHGLISETRVGASLCAKLGPIVATYRR